MLVAWAPDGKLQGVSASSLFPREVDLAAVACEGEKKVNQTALLLLLTPPFSSFPLKYANLKSSKLLVLDNH